MKRKLCGVYEIRNTVNGKRYVGSSIHLKTRFNKHTRRLNKNKHKNQRLQDSWNKYGEDNFAFNILSICEEKYLIEAEQWFLDNTDCEYNIYKYADSSKGYKHTKETKEKLSELARNRKPVSKKTREKMSKAHMGNAYCLGFKHTEETKRKMSRAKIGKTHSEESKRKIGNANRGKTISEEHRAAVAEANRKRVVSDKTRKKMSESQKKRFARERKERELVKRGE